MDSLKTASNEKYVLGIRVTWTAFIQHQDDEDNSLIFGNYEKDFPLSKAISIVANQSLVGVITNEEISAIPEISYNISVAYYTKVFKRTF